MSLFLEITGAAIAVMLPMCFFMLKHLSKKTIDKHFDERLAKYKSELELLGKQVEFDYTRKGAAFNIYFNKKHESYIGYYDLISKANGLVRSLYGFREDVPVEMMKVEDITERLKNCGYSNAVTTEYIERIEKNGIQAVKAELDKLFRSYEFNTAQNSCYAAKNHLILSRLYFDSELYEKALSLSNEMLFLFNSYKVAFQIQGGGSREDEKQYIKNIDKLMEEIIPIMQSELGVGYFEVQTPT